MEQLHQLAALADEDEYVTIAYITSHPFMHYTTERTDTFTHIGFSWAQVVAHCIVKAKHDLLGSWLIIP